jgi:uncharacterized protein (TIGR02246 family)
MDHAGVQRWLDNYVQAWLTYDPQQITDLFSEDAVYHYGPYQEPVKGREAIVANWLENRDKPGTYKAQYHPVAVEGNTAVANGRSTYFEADGKTFLREFDNIYVIHFDDNGRCKEFAEWYMEKPKQR